MRCRVVDIREKEKKKSWKMARRSRYMRWEWRGAEGGGMARKTDVMVSSNHVVGTVES
jgi:hypothetical protein